MNLNRKDVRINVSETMYIPMSLSCVLKALSVHMYCLRVIYRGQIKSLSLVRGHVVESVKIFM